MGRKQKGLIAAGIILAVIFLAFLLYKAGQSAVLNPAGLIAEKEKRLFVFVAASSLLLIIPVYIMLFGFAWKFRESNKRAKYRPEWDGNRLIEGIWWGVPGALILVLSIITWQASHALDPFKPIDSAKKPLEVEVIALQWRWLFIYPEQDVATVNHLQLPKDTPVNFKVTADSPMNSFWIPQLGGQIYAMSGMATRIHLLPEKLGTYQGSSANISGAGFADMRFKAEVVEAEDFEKWIQDTRRSPQVLTISEYHKLAEPSKDKKVISYFAQDEVFDYVLGRFVRPGNELPVGEELYDSHGH